MREGIARYGGYEIGTEGDSFHIAFRSVADAVHFCMEVQMLLLETSWPREVLKLGPCKTVADGNKEVLFRGPRVRMSIHWAIEGTIAHRCVGACLPVEWGMVCCVSVRGRVCLSVLLGMWLLPKPRCTLACTGVHAQANPCACMCVVDVTVLMYVSFQRMARLN